MGILVILSLVYKRYREEPRRPWRIWCVYPVFWWSLIPITIYHRLFDVSKQVVGQMFVHGVNVLISGVISELTDRNACVFYFLNILVDTTVGEYKPFLAISPLLKGLQASELSMDACISLTTYSLRNWVGRALSLGSTANLPLSISGCDRRRHT